MAFKLHISNELKPLAMQLTADLTLHGMSIGVMQSQWIITQTEGMNSWLKNTIAREMGIAANIRFLQPADVVSKIEWMVDDRDNISRSISREEMCWTIYEMLGEKIFIERFPLVSGYYLNDELRQATFAAKVADLFDQYLIYRSDAIASWNKAESSGEDDWQSVLWRMMRERLGWEISDRTEVANRIIEKLSNNEIREKVKSRLPHLYIFGIAVITPFFQRIFRQLAQSTDIHLYLLNPAPELYWLDFRSEKQLARLLQKPEPPPQLETAPMLGNDLLLNWGKIIRDSFLLLFRDEEMINQCNDRLSIPPVAPISLLKKLQFSIYYNLSAVEMKEFNTLAFDQSDCLDGSVTLAGCYTPAREVETLYNFLVSIIDQPDSSISSRDILVMVPDIDVYAPYIHAVFGHAKHKFRYTIADETLTADDNLFSAVRSILEFNGDQFKARDLMDMLDNPYIRKRFNLEDTDKLREAVREALIIKSYTGEGDTQSRLISWEHGLKRMVYGLCMQLEDHQEFNDGYDSILLLDSVEGMAGLDRIRLAYLVKTLHQKIKARTQPRKISGWAEYLKELLEDMVFQASEREDEDYPRFIRLIEELTDMNSAAQATVSYDVFCKHFLEKLSVERRSQHFAGKGITFCSLIPMRSIPFRFVAILGMNFDTFPRRENPVNFSLLSEYRIGDRNIKENDKHLFLETLLSAREKFYISYLAKSEKDGSDLPPSIIVDELVDFVSRALGIKSKILKERWIKIHPLHSFSNKYGSEENQFKNYLSPQRFLTNLPVEKAKAQQPIQVSENLNVSDLAKFMKNPPKIFLNKRFGIWYYDEDLLLPEHECFEPDYFSNKRLMAQLIEKKETEARTWAVIQSKKGKLPPGNLGKAMVQLTLESLSSFKAAYDKVVKGHKQEALDVNYQNGQYSLSGQVTSIFTSESQKQLLGWSLNDKVNKQLIEAWVVYVALVASGYKLDFSFLLGDKKSVHIPAGKISFADASRLCDRYISYYIQGIQGYFPFHPLLINYVAKPEGYESLMNNLDDQQFGIFNDPYFLRAVEDGFLSQESWKQICEQTGEILHDIHVFYPDLLK